MKLLLVNPSKPRRRLGKPMGVPSRPIARPVSKRSGASRTKPKLTAAQIAKLKAMRPSSRRNPEEEEKMMYRGKRRRPVRAAKKAPARRRRRNPAAAAPAKAPAKRRARQPSAAEVAALKDVEALKKKLAEARKRTAEAREEAKTAKAKAAKAKRAEAAKTKSERAQKRAIKKYGAGRKGYRTRGSAAQRKRVLATLQDKQARGLTLLPVEQAQLVKLLAAKPTRKARAPKARTKNQKWTSAALRKGSKAPRATKAVAKAWRAAKNAERLAQTPAQRKLLKAMGLAGVPNRTPLLKSIGTMMPQVAGGVGALAAVALGAEKLGGMISSKVPAAVQPYVVPATSVALATTAYAITSRSKNDMVRNLSGAILIGGIGAAVVHTLRHVKVGGQSLGAKIGLPLGEYTAVGEYTDFGEYTAIGYSDGGIFAGADDIDPVLLSGADDIDPVLLSGEDDEEGMMEFEADNGVLSGSIFD